MIKAKLLKSVLGSFIHCDHPIQMTFTDLLQSGGNMEILETPKHRASIGRHYYTLPADLGFCARKGFVKQYQEQQRKHTGTGECRSNRINPTLTPLSAI